jgi:hypothetical protein
MLIPEPENIKDKGAVAIKRLDGTSLGYVPIVDQGQLHEGQVYFGRVCKAGKFEDKGVTIHYARVSPTSCDLFSPNRSNQDDRSSASQRYKAPSCVDILLYSLTTSRVAMLQLNVAKFGV